MKYIISLEQITQEHHHVVGGKAKNLALIHSIGLPVPRGFCITTQAFEKVIRQTGSDRLIGQLNTRTNIPEVAANIRHTIQNSTIPSDIVDEICSAYQQLHPSSDAVVACRSSGTDEDLATVSFAGQYVTRLGVYGKDALFSSIKACWASIFNPSVIEYRIRQGLTDLVSGMAVVVQVLVQAEQAGVAFSIDPSRHDSHTLLIEASWGLGESVVSGTVEPDCYWLDRTTGILLESTLGKKRVRLASSADGELEVFPLQEELRNRFCLHPDQLRQLWQGVMKLEAYFKMPVDVEFAFGQTMGTSQQFYVLQCRPITGIYNESGSIGLSREVEVHQNRPIFVKGIGITTGYHQGQARHITPDTIDCLQPDEVLIAKKLTIKLYPAMYKAGAIVTEEGEFASHTSTVARELGIPCIIKARGFIDGIVDQQWIGVDSTHGVVYKLDNKEDVAFQDKSTTLLSNIEGKTIFAVTSIKSAGYLQRHYGNVAMLDLSRILTVDLSTRTSGFSETLKKVVHNILPKIAAYHIRTIRVWIPDENVRNEIFADVSKAEFLAVVPAQLHALTEQAPTIKRILIPASYQKICEVDAASKELWLDVSETNSLFRKKHAAFHEQFSGICVTIEQAYALGATFETPLMVVCETTETAQQAYNRIPWASEFCVLDSRPIFVNAFQ